MEGASKDRRGRRGGFRGPELGGREWIWRGKTEEGDGEGETYIEQADGSRNVVLVVLQWQLSRLSDGLPSLLKESRKGGKEGRVS